MKRNAVDGLFMKLSSLNTIIITVISTAKVHFGAEKELHHLGNCSQESLRVFDNYFRHNISGYPPDEQR